MSYALTDRTWKSSYKNVLQMKSVSFLGVSSTFQKVIDGYANESGLELKKDGVRIVQGRKLEFQDDGNIYIQRSAEDKLLAKTPKFVIDGGLSIMNGALETASLVTDEIDVSKAVVSNLSGKLVVCTAASCGTVKGTLLNVSTVSGDIVKGTQLVFNTARVVNGRLSFNASGASNDARIEVDANSYFFIFGSDKCLIVEKDKVYHDQDNYCDLGTAAKRFKTARIITAHLGTCNANKLYALSGGILSNLSRVRSASGAIDKLVIGNVLQVASLYHDTSRSVYTKYDPGTQELRYFDGKIVMKADAIIQPSIDAVGTIGAAAKRFSKGYFVTASADTTKGANGNFANGNISDLGVARLAITGVKFTVPGLYSTSASAGTGEVYIDSGTLKVKLGA